jgi:NDP-sugar pyrophosphorylase family protein
MNYRQKFKEIFQMASDELFAVDDTPEGWISLTDHQIRLLEDNGNSSEDWPGVKILSNAMLNSVRNCVFSGEIRIAMNTTEVEGCRIDPVLKNCFLENVTILPGCRIENSYMLRNLHIGEGTVIENCGRLTYEHGSTCGCGVELELGVETGERNVPSSPCLDVLLASVLSGSSDRAENLAMYHKFLDEFLLKTAGSVPGCLSLTPVR